jgi:predicted  nucleic acid-binding Zn-ribbon protein
MKGACRGCGCQVSHPDDVICAACEGRRLASKAQIDALMRKDTDDENKKDRVQERAGAEEVSGRGRVQETILVGHTGQYLTRDKGPFAAVVICVHEDGSFDLQVTLPSRKQNRHFFYAERVRTTGEFHHFRRV